jgi:hypothetical protein
VSLTLDQLPPPPPDVSFKVLRLEERVLPHPYCITPKHLQYADSIYLDGAAIERAESKGAVCDICRAEVKNRRQPSILKYSEHEKVLMLFIGVSANQQKDLNKVKGLHSYLLKIKKANLGIGGFAFPTL